MPFPPRPQQLLVLLFAALTSAASALAAPPSGAGGDPVKDKPNNERRAKDAVDDRADPRANSPEVGKGTRVAKQPLKPGAYFNEQARTSVREYYARTAHCPPGLARKNNGCMPPGQARKWQIGQPISRQAARAPLPPDVLPLLPALPPGHRYVAYGGDILLIAAGSRMVVDAITLTVTTR